MLLMKRVEAVIPVTELDAAFYGKAGVPGGTDVGQPTVSVSDKEGLVLVWAWTEDPESPAVALNRFTPDGAMTSWR